MTNWLIPQSAKDRRDRVVDDRQLGAPLPESQELKRLTATMTIEITHYGDPWGQDLWEVRGIVPLDAYDRTARSSQLMDALSHVVRVASYGMGKIALDSEDRKKS